MDRLWWRGELKATHSLVEKLGRLFPGYDLGGNLRWASPVTLFDGEFEVVRKRGRMMSSREEEGEEGEEGEQRKKKKRRSGEGRSGWIGGERRRWMSLTAIESRMISYDSV